RFRNLGDQECVIVSANTPPTFSDGGEQLHH
ncbi:XRE family transcriptional regulator, partial [Halomonas sp. SYSU XM8]